MGKYGNILSSWVCIGLLAGCSLNFSAPILPGLKGEFPDHTSTSGLNPGVPLAAYSGDPASSGAKQVIAQLRIATELVNQLALRNDGNCVQLVRLINLNTVLVDFFASPCPADGRPLSAAALKFSLGYQEISEDYFQLTNQGRAVGLMSLNAEGTVLTLSALCSGSYISACYPRIATGLFSGEPYYF